MKVKVCDVILITSMIFMPNMLFAQQLPSGILVYTSPDMQRMINMLHSHNEAKVELSRRGGARRGGGYHSRPVRSRPRARPRAAPHRTHRAYRHSYRTIRGRRMRLYVAGTGIALIVGATCYVDQYDYGRISGKKCCIGSGCYSTFYVD